MTQIQNWSDVPMSILQDIQFVLTDIDDTLTLHGKLPALAYESIQRLAEVGIKVIPITGRPAGWCDHIARMWPVEGIVGENGAFYFRYDQAEKRMLRVYVQSHDERQGAKSILWQIARDVLTKYPGTAIASDQAYREIDVAIDFCEDVPALSLSVAQSIAEDFQRQGAVAKVSSIHVNAWFGSHDKLTTSLRMLSEVFRIDSSAAKESVAYCGDSPNDSPMFGYFPMSIAVANARPLLDLMPEKPAYITVGEGGLGFAEVASRILASRT